MSTDKELAVQQRRKQSLTLRLSGMTYAEIAENLGVSNYTAWQDVNQALADIPKSEADQLREEEVGRLDRMQRAVWDAALAGDLQAMQTVLKIVDRRAKLLGLDAPQQVELSGDADLDAVVRKIISAADNEQEASGE